MQLFGTQKVNSKGHLEIGGCDVVELAREFGTPLYVMDEEQLRDNCQAYRKAFESRYPDVQIIYAAKAFLTTAMCKIAEQEGLGLDISSGGELYTALAADFPPHKIYLHGNNKSEQEIKMALDSGVGRIVVDNLYELEMLNKLAKERNITAKILLRLTPGVDTHTHIYDQTGRVDTKFGLHIEDGIAEKAVERALNLRNIDFMGLHCHIGSQLLELKPFKITIQIMMQFIKKIYQERKVTVKELNLGGGLGVRYTPVDEPPTLNQFAEVIVSSLKKEAQNNNLKLPKLVFEPGRSIVGEAGTTIYTVGAIKTIPGGRKYIAVDGGMSDNPRPALYDAKYNAIVANKANEKPQEIVTIAGKHCESDVLIWDIDLPRVEPGDLLAVQSTGAYCYSMASNYNRLPRPAVLLVYKGKADLIVQRETYQDLIRLDRIPERLQRKRGK